jgi:hypothetical protein
VLRGVLIKFWRYIQANWNLNIEKGNRDLPMMPYFKKPTQNDDTEMQNSSISTMEYIIK